MRNRRHHCRKCGLLVCGECSTKKLLFKSEGKEAPFRVCDKCFNFAHTTTLIKKKQYNNRDIRQCDYLAMKTMNLTENNSYMAATHSYIALSRQVNLDDIKMQADDDEKHAYSNNLNNNNSKHASSHSANDFSVFGKNKNKNKNKTDHTHSR